MQSQPTPTRHPTRVRGMAAVAAATALAAAGCATPGSAPDAGEVTITTPFDSCLSWYPLYVADENGYFEDEGIDAQLQGTDSSGGAVQAVLSGQAQLASTAPDAYLSSAASGADIQAFYALYQRSSFQLIAPQGSGIEELSDVAGHTVGISNPGGGDVVYSEWLLASQAGLEAGEDYEQLAVGNGSSAATALSDGSIDAHSAAFFHEEVIREGELDMDVVAGEDTPDVVGNLLVADDTWVAENGDTVDSVGRALARATEWGMENAEGVVDLCGRHAPEEVQDRAFAETIHGRVSGLLELPESADGQYGHIDTDAFTVYAEELAELGLVESAEGAQDVHNDHVGAWNTDGS
ncbi:ABC transporter substrate-binding protein [Nocardiopsis sp. HNM0947]|uniref:Thiamine pyrimidine synthase n=1 Tax=Nocardiopsis coralli TaxID=2772213 RepID=A0ABR9PAI0_9ACTN|nr:ABC transporter substrate-binding protein [Nocardiopsis coralli]MBE3000849.1 ABC transporter substrate-binding protein [Nocardiopsis coralli]